MATPTPDSKESDATHESTAAPEPAKQHSGYYEYMFEKDKSPTRTLDALLRAIGQYIIDEIGDKDDTVLTPKKLAAFYRAVGGDYDSLFLGMPHQSISYVYQVTGCQHTMQPTSDDYEAPSVPALTLRGFVRWESIEILLGPEDHVPYMQFAVENWDLTNPNTGEKFPKELPADVFPSEPDEDVDKWHKSCADKLRRDATPKDEETAPRERSERPERPDPRLQAAYAHIRNPQLAHSSRARVDGDYFARPVSLPHGPGRHHGQRLAPKSPDRYRRGSSLEDRVRRRSLSDYPSPPQEHMASPGRLDPGRSIPLRRHSQPRHLSSSSSESDEEPPSPRSKRRPRHPEDLPPGVRRVVPPPSAPQPPPAAPAAPPAVPNLRQHRTEMRQEEARRRSFPIPFDGFREKFAETVNSFLPNNSANERPRSSSRNHSHNGTHRRSREQLPTKLSRSWSDLDSDNGPESDESAAQRRRRKFRDRERERESDRDRDRERHRHWDRGRDEDRERDRDAYRDEDRGSRSRRDRDRHLPRPERPEAHRRTSSHADADRRRGEVWDPREREWVRDDRKRWDS